MALSALNAVNARAEARLSVRQFLSFSRGLCLVQTKSNMKRYFLFLISRWKKAKHDTGQLLMLMLIIMRYLPRLVGHTYTGISPPYTFISFSIYSFIIITITYFLLSPAFVSKILGYCKQKALPNPQSHCPCSSPKPSTYNTTSHHGERCDRAKDNQSRVRRFASRLRRVRTCSRKHRPAASGQL